MVAGLVTVACGSYVSGRIATSSAPNPPAADAGAALVIVGRCYLITTDPTDPHCWYHSPVWL